MATGRARRIERATQFLLLTVLLLSTASCGEVTGPTGLPGASAVASEVPSASARPATAVPTSSATSRPPGATCRATDQDLYVYHPARLQVLRACLRVSGTVAFIRREADGDLHMGLALDAGYGQLVVAANQGVERGDLVIEPVCEMPVTQADAVATCAADPDPLRGLPVLGEHIWMEGRYVADLPHGGWRELHPLYRWGTLS